MELLLRIAAELGQAHAHLILADLEAADQVGHEGRHVAEGIVADGLRRVDQQNQVRFLLLTHWEHMEDLRVWFSALLYYIIFDALLSTILLKVRHCSPVYSTPYFTICFTVLYALLLQYSILYFTVQLS